jgi:6-phosphogluconolactonase (cycloisomerase 2 family)
MPASPFQVGATSVWIAIDPSGRFLYVSLDAAGIGAYTIDPDSGTLSAVQGSPFAAPSAVGFMLVDPSGVFLYAGTGSTTAGVLGFRIDQSTGALTPNSAGLAPGNIVWSLAVTY